LLNKYTIQIVMILSVLGGCTGSQTLVDVEDIQDSLVPGLQVLFFNGMYRNVRQIPDGDMAILEKGRPGSPILLINNQFGNDEVFDSGRNRGVGVQMKGYLLVDQKGSYEFQALSNDGVEVIIDGNSILIDPNVHSDRLSNIGTLSVQKTGWHSLMVKYFQRKGTAALTLFWKRPGKDEFEVIPAKAYAHLPDDPKDN
jgi:hypothetical protein